MSTPAGLFDDQPTISHVLLDLVDRAMSYRRDGRPFSANSANSPETLHFRDGLADAAYERIKTLIEKRYATQPAADRQVGIGDVMYANALGQQEARLYHDGDAPQDTQAITLACLDLLDVLLDQTAGPERSIAARAWAQMMRRLLVELG